jgi:putative SOS response-associated peptidase YedK
MCGRFTLRTPAIELVRFFELVAPIHELAVRWNVAPTQKVLAIRKGDQGREPSWLRWGLIPSWAKDSKIGNSLINARADTIAEKPSFRSAFKQRRCLVVADGYYEWKQTTEGKIPYLMTLQDNSPFAFAGIWERWKNPSGEVIETCSTVTTEPNALVAMVHDRMPVILKPDDYNQWLDPAFQDTEQLKAMLVAYPPEEMKVEEVSKAINNARNEVDPRLTSSY